MSYGNEKLSALAQEIKQYIYDSTIYETDPEAIKGNAAWWASQIGSEAQETHDALEELTLVGPLFKDGEGEEASYIYAPVTVVSPELHGNR